MYKYLMGRNEEEGVRFSIVPTDKTGSTEHKVKNKTGNTTHTQKKKEKLNGRRHFFTMRVAKHRWLPSDVVESSSVAKLKT